jgi:hypothetical protein
MDGVIDTPQLDFDKRLHPSSSAMFQQNYRECQQLTNVMCIARVSHNLTQQYAKGAAFDKQEQVFSSVWNPVCGDGRLDVHCRLQRVCQPHVAWTELGVSDVPCTLVVTMHGVLSSKVLQPLKRLMRLLVIFVGVHTLLVIFPVLVFTTPARNQPNLLLLLQKKGTHRGLCSKDCCGTPMREPRPSVLWRTSL